MSKQAVLSVLILVFVLAGGASALATYDLVADWTPSARPPTGLGTEAVWSYGTANWDQTNRYAATTFTAFPNWSMGPPSWFNLLCYNTATPYGTTASSPPVFAKYGSPSRIWAHSPSNGSAVCIRWRAPRTMYVSISGTTQVPYATADRPVTFLIRKTNSTVLYERNVTGTDTSELPISITGVVQVSAGETIDVLEGVGPNSPSSIGTFQAVSLVITEFALSAPTFSPIGCTFVYKVDVAINDASPGAVIHYTTDGSTPTAASPTYAGPVTLYAGATVKAYATLAGWADSSITSATFTKISAPITWNSVTDWQDNVLPPVGLGPDGAWSYGRGDGYQASSPTGPITFVPYTNFGPDPWAMNVQAYQFSTAPPPLAYRQPSAWWASHTPSDGSSSVLRWTAPRAMNVILSGTTQTDAWNNPNDHTDSRPIRMLIRKNNDAPLYNRYAPPGDNGTYTIPTIPSFSVEPGDVIDFIGGAGQPAGVNMGGGYTSDGVGTFVRTNLTIAEVAGSWKLPAPTFSPIPGNYAPPQTVTISESVAGAAIHYTTDGSAPTSASTTYAAPLTVSTSTTIRAIAVKSAWVNSNIVTAAYTFYGPTPVFNPPSGTFTNRVNVTITCDTPGTPIRYTTDGSDPTPSSSLYSAPITITHTTVVKAKSYAAGLDPSPTVSANYTQSGKAAGIWDLAADWVDNSLPATNIGPDWAWSYGHAPSTQGDPSSYVTFLPLEEWNTSPFAYSQNGDYYEVTGDTPQLAKRHSGDSAWSGLDWPEGTVMAHTGEVDDPLILRWTAPRDMTVSVTTYCYVGYKQGGGANTGASAIFGVRHNGPAPAYVIGPAQADWNENSQGANDPYNARVTSAASGINVLAGESLDLAVWPLDVPGAVGVNLRIEQTLPTQTIGRAKTLGDAEPVAVEDAVVTADSSLVAGSVFVEAADRSSGIRVVTGDTLSLGQRVKFTGTIHRVDGEYLFDDVQFSDKAGGDELPPVGAITRTIGSDMDETLNYFGIDMTGMLVRLAGKTSKLLPDERIIYVDDGGKYEDGLAPLTHPVEGIRVHVTPDVTFPTTPVPVVVTGIYRVEKHTLTEPGRVNGRILPAGTVLYVPAIHIRDKDDYREL